MPELKITVVMPETPAEEEGKALDDLMSTLAAEAGRHAQLGREPGFHQKEGPNRVFTGRFSSREALSAMLRASGGWYMRHPWATITYKMESSKGGRTLQFKSYSPVAMAKASVQLEEYLEE